jgi:hypothetical protein
MQYGPALSKVPADKRSASNVAMAESLPEGGAIDLPRSVPCGTLDFSSQNCRAWFFMPHWLPPMALAGLD